MQYEITGLIINDQPRFFIKTKYFFISIPYKIHQENIRRQGGILIITSHTIIFLKLFDEKNELFAEMKYWVQFPCILSYRFDVLQELTLTPMV